MEKLKIAIIGVGNIAGAHIDAYLKNPNAELYAFCDINPNRLQLMGNRYGISRLYTDEETMLKELPEIDAVSICTWNSAHAPCTIMALNAGKHVLCEKPMAINAEEAQAMLDAAKKNNKKLMIGFVRRFGNDADLTKDLIDSGRLGEPYYGKAVNIRRNGNPGGWFGEKARSGGGPLIDIGVHIIDLTRYLIGRPHVSSVYAVTFNKLSDTRPSVKTPKGYVSASATNHDIFDCEDLASALIRFDNGFALSVEVSFNLNTGKESNGVEIFGTDGGVEITGIVNLYNVTDGYLSNVGFVGKTGFDFNNAFAAEINNFLQYAKGEAECRNPAEDGVEMMKILDAIYASAESGHEIVIE